MKDSSLYEALKSCKYFIEELHESNIAINYNLLFKIDAALSAYSNTPDESGEGRKYTDRDMNDYASKAAAAIMDYKNQEIALLKSELKEAQIFISNQYLQSKPESAVTEGEIEQQSQKVYPYTEWAKNIFKDAIKWYQSRLSAKVEPVGEWEDRFHENDMKMAFMQGCGVNDCYQFHDWFAEYTGKSPNTSKQVNEGEEN